MWANEQNTRLACGFAGFLKILALSQTLSKFYCSVQGRASVAKFFLFLSSFNKCQHSSLYYYRSRLRLLIGKLAEKLSEILFLRGNSQNIYSKASPLSKSIKLRVFFLVIFFYSEISKKHLLPEVFSPVRPLQHYRWTF